MGKIDEILSEINQFISGDDWSETLQIRRAVAAYAQACKEVSAKLAECRELLDKDLVLDAQHLNTEMTPSLTERAAKLYMHGLKYERLTQLCEMYHYNVPPLIDMATVKDLRTSKSDTAMNALILRWRKIARGHDNPEKIDLLREILANDPADVKMWESNLLTVEKKYISEIQLAAEQAAADGNNKKVIEYYNILTSDNWLSPTEAVAERFLPIVQATRQEMFNNALEHKRNDLFTAYSIMDPAMIRTLLKEYDAMTRNKLYRKDPQAERAVDDVRKFLVENEEAQKKQKEFDQKKSALLALLDQHGNYENIENLYDALRRLDLPLDDNLSLRVANRREEYIAEINRRHTRKCVYWVMSILLLIGIAAAALITLQSYRSFRSYHAQMSDLLKKGNYEGVMKLYAEEKQNSPLALHFGNLDSINLEAERLHKEQLERHKILKDLLTQGEKELEKESPELNELKTILANAAKYKDDKLSADLAKQYRNFEKHVQLIEQQIRNDLENEFDEKITPYINLLKKYCTDLQNTSDLEKIGNDISTAQANAQKLIDDYQSRIPEYVKSYQELLKSHIESLEEEIKKSSQLRSLLLDLAKPQDVESYLKALKTLPQKSPSRAGSIWKNAIAMLPVWESLINSQSLFRQYGKDPEKMQEQLNQNNFFADNNMIAADYAVLENTHASQQKFSDKRAVIESELAAKYNLYELIFSSSDGKLWYLYSDKNPNFTTGNSSRRIIGISMDFKTGSNETNFLEIDTKNKNQFFVYTEYSALPKQFAVLKNHRLSSANAPKARHYTALQYVIKDLNQIKSPLDAENVIIQYLELITHDKLMNPFARAELIYYLLDLLAECSPMHSKTCQKFCSEIESAAKITFNNWYMPDAMSQYQQILLNINKVSAGFDLEQLKNKSQITRNLYRTALSRDLHPAGVILKNGSKTTVKYFNTLKNIRELWVYTADQNAGSTGGWIVIPSTAVANDKTLTQNLIDQPHGTLFFTPIDYQDTRELTNEFKKEMQSKNIQLQQWPSSWPLNMR